MNKKQLKDWEIEKGIIIKPKVNRLKNKAIKYSESGYRELIKTNSIKIATEKGIEYLEEIRGRKRRWQDRSTYMQKR